MIRLLASPFLTTELWLLQDREAITQI